MLLPEFFQQHDQRIVQVATSSQVHFALYTQSTPWHDTNAFSRESQHALARKVQHWQSFHVMTENSTAAGMGLLQVLYGSEQADVTHIVHGRSVTVSPFRVIKSVTKECLRYISYFDNAHILQEAQTQIQKRHNKLFFWVFCCHTACTPSALGTLTGGVQ